MRAYVAQALEILTMIGLGLLGAAPGPLAGGPPAAPPSPDKPACRRP